eukprot:CAMPEP_0172893152 /NCGR_PEP_ID=MMETSP1075-20121228/147810_1 /TAXON_ID=2916 /ORGANISM="Ceratium fusus, Strain PA161109" /LENGTH=295 /DNA_ID=CAMNT_0013747961 /DNA_START=51 /DNA_END=935 /DNA_ORIENTATION=-
MATFGRKIAATSRGVRSSASKDLGSVRGRDDEEEERAYGESAGYRRLKEELAERERFAEEFEKSQEQKAREDAFAARDRASAFRNAAVVARPNPQVYLDVEVRSWECLGQAGKLEASGRLEFELFADVVPRTAENFRCLCTGERGKRLYFRGSPFHRIVPGFMAQGGDITDGDGSGGSSIYGKTFDDENFSLKHDKRGLLSMANSGPGTNNSQFFVLFRPAPHLDRKHVVFGRLLRDPAQVLPKIEAKGSRSGDVKAKLRLQALAKFRCHQWLLHEKFRHDAPRAPGVLRARGAL